MEFQRKIFCLLLVFSAGTLGYGQISVGSENRNPYYIDLNHSSVAEIFEIRDALLSLRYHDKLGRSNNLILKVFDWKRKLVAQFQLQKTYGLNYFNLKLDDGLTLENDKIYTCEASNEMGEKLLVYFKPIVPVVTESPSVNILVNPINFNCEEPTNNNVAEFYGDISGGKPPYSVDWYILNNTRTDLLYQPKNEIIPRSGSTSVIHVDKDPEYYVMLLVTDACGAEGRQMVRLVCEAKNKKINSIFVEPLRTLPGTIKNRQ